MKCQKNMFTRSWVPSCTDFLLLFTTWLWVLPKLVGQCLVPSLAVNSSNMRASGGPHFTKLSDCICHKQSRNLRNLQIALHNLGIHRLYSNLGNFRLLKYDPIWWLEQCENYFLAQSADRSVGICISVRWNLQIVQGQSADLSVEQFEDQWRSIYVLYIQL